MELLILALFSALGTTPPAAMTPSLLVPTGLVLRVEIPMKAPAGWRVEEQDRATLMTPADVPEGRFYRVMVTIAKPPVGKLDDLLSDGRKMVEEIGVFKTMGDSALNTSTGGWEYKGTLGSIETKDRAMLGYLTAFHKGDEGGVVVLLSDSVETMTTYTDAFAGMMREMGDSKPAPAPLKPGPVPIEHRTPAAWVETKLEGLPYLVKEKNEQWVKYRMSLLVLPGEALTGSLRTQFEGFWRSYVTPNFVTRIAPMPMMRRLGSGYACAFDADSQAKDKAGGEATVALYVVAQGDRVVPVLGVFSGPDWTMDRAAETEIGELLESVRLPGAASAKVELFSAAALAGEWSESGSEFANYVDRGGSYAGDATVSTGTYLDLKADGSYARTLVALTGGRNVREKDAGTWTVQDHELVLSPGGRYSLLGYGADAKVGRFLVLGTYVNRKVQLKLTNPRGILQALWMKAK